MCQLLGMNCNTPTDVTFSFRGFAQRGGHTDHHADGWGIAFFEGDDSVAGGSDKGLRHFVDHQPACSSPVAELISRYPIKSRNVISHIRKATQGRVALENCHPFVRELWGRYWVFAHNGDLKDFAPRLHGSFRPVGTTDSERAFCWIMQEMAKSHAGVPSVQELSITLRELSAQIAEPRHLQFPAEQRPGAVGARLHEPLLRGAQTSLRPCDAERRRRERELRRAHAAYRQGRRGGHGAADHE
jgi:predicted glutamine amidotransferase